MPVGKKTSWAWFTPGLLILVLIFVCHSVLAQNYTISKITVEGNKIADPTLILNVSGLLVGTPLEAEAIEKAIRQIYNLGLFSDVKILGTQTPEGLELSIQVQEYPRIARIEIEGNRKFKDTDLKDKISLSEGKLASPYEVQESANKLKAFYNEKGYFLAQVETQAEPNPSGELVLKFKINEGEKVKVRGIEIEGNRIFSDKKIRKQMKTKPKGILRSGNFEELKYQEDKDRIIDFYKREGYLDATVVSDSIWYGPDKKKMFIRLTVSEGDRYQFGKVGFEGHKLFITEKLLQQVRFQEGEIFSQKKYEETQANIENLYLDEGYIYLRIQDKQATRGKVVDITFQINEGSQAHVYKINIEGNTKTKEKVIRRELSLKPGDVFKRNLLMRSLRDVSYLNYFANVVPNYEVLPNGDIDLTIKVEEKPTGQITFGAGYSERDKLVGTLGLGIPNLFGNGQSVQLNMDFGSRRNTFQISFTDPWFRDTPTSVGFDLYNVNRRWYDDYTEETRGAGLRLGKRLYWPDNYFRIFWGYRFESVRYKEFSDIYKTIADSLFNKYGHADSIIYPYRLVKIDWPQLTSSMSLTITRDNRDLPQFATKGSAVSWTGELAGGPLGGDWDYHKHIIDLAGYLPSFWKFTLVAKARIGIINSWGGDRKIPYIERFAPGGANNPDGVIRGYPDAWIGPRTPEGALLRGKAEIIYNLEYQFPLVEQQFYGILLADAGNAWLSYQDIKPFPKHLFKSVGAGVRMVVPSLGTIGFDIAYGYDYTDPGWRPHFIFGSRF